MAFLKTTKTFIVRDYLDGNKARWQQATVDITVSAKGTVSWKITMNNDRQGSSGRGVYLEVKIGSTTVQKGGYTYYENKEDARWSKYPTGNGSSTSGSFDTTASKLTVEIYVCCMQPSTENGKSIKETLYRITTIGKGTVKIEDNLDNTFKISGTKGANGTDNVASGPTLSWGYTNSYSNSLKSGTTSSEAIKLTITDSSKATKTVYAKSVTEAEHGDDTVATAYLGIKQYVKPGPLSNIQLKYEKSRLTIKEPWTLSWDPASPTNSSSPVAGYRIRIYKGGAEPKYEGTSVPFRDDEGNVLTTDTGKDVHYRYHYDRSNPSTTFTFDPKKVGHPEDPIKPGDAIQFLMHAFSKDGKGGKYYSDGVWSDPFIVQNAGIIRVKVNNEWKEGTVYVKANGSWKEASTVSVKTSTGWKEST